MITGSNRPQKDRMGEEKKRATMMEAGMGRAEEERDAPFSERSYQPPLVVRCDVCA